LSFLVIYRIRTLTDPANPRGRLRAEENHALSNIERMSDLLHAGVARQNCIELPYRQARLAVGLDDRRRRAMFVRIASEKMIANTRTGIVNVASSPHPSASALMVMGS
jgi:hypothetical protein